MPDVTVIEQINTVAVVTENAETLIFSESGTQGQPGREIELQKSATHIQWRYAGDISWTNLVSLSDITGPTGAAGQNGATGSTGATGSQGPAGDAATLTLGTVTTGAVGSSVIITNSGTSSAAVFNFTIPRGDTGATGATGATGSAGATGAAGADGADGREVEIQNNGTHIQWRYVGDVSWTNIVALTAITGPQGPTGATGATGPAGAGVTSGVVEIDFGSTPSNEASATVTHQHGILTTSTVDAQIMARSSTNNTITDHEFGALALRFSVSEPVADTGFTIKAFCTIGFATGKFNVNWRWS